METWESGVNEIGEKEFLNSSFSSIEAEDLAPINLPTEAPALAYFKYQDIRETLRVKKSLNAIMNKVNLMKMATFVDATKELQLTTLPNLQLLVSAINEAVYNTDRAEVFAIFCKEVSRDNPNFRRQLLTNLQNNFKLRLKSDEEEKELGQHQDHE